MHDECVWSYLNRSVDRGIQLPIHNMAPAPSSMHAVFKQIRARQKPAPAPAPAPASAAQTEDVQQPLALDPSSSVWPRHLKPNNNRTSSTAFNPSKRNCNKGGGRNLSVLQEADELEDCEFADEEENDENYPVQSSENWNSDSVSFAKRCEAKLESLLNLAINSYDIDIYAQRTDACFQVLDELWQSKVPFSRLLRHICTELKCAFYHEDAAGESINGAAMKKSFCESARELEQEISRMEAENATWKSSLLEQETDLRNTQAHLQNVRDKLTDADSASQELEEKIAATVKALASEEKKINGLHEKIKHLKQELRNIRHEVKQAKHIELVKASEVEQYAKLKTLYMQCVHEFQHVQECLRSSQNELAESAPKADILAAKVEIRELRDKIYHLKSEIDAFTAATGHLTPRPQWGGHMPGMDKPSELSTAKQIERICRENAFLAENISRLQLDFAVSEAAQLSSSTSEGKGQGNPSNSTRSSGKEKAGGGGGSTGRSNKTREKPAGEKKKKTEKNNKKKKIEKHGEKKTEKP